IHRIRVFGSTIQHVMSHDGCVRIRPYLGNKSAAPRDVRDYFARGLQIDVRSQSVEQLSAFGMAPGIADSVTNTTEVEIVGRKLRKRGSERRTGSFKAGEEALLEFDRGPSVIGAPLKAKPLVQIDA